MEQSISQMVGGVVNILTAQIIKHLRYVTSSGKYVTDMENKMKDLEGKSEDVTKHKERNYLGNQEIPARVPGWMDEVENVKKQVTSISSYSNNGCLHMKKRYRAGRNALKTIEEIERLINEENKIKWSDATIPLGRVDSKLASTSARPSPSGKVVTGGDFESRDKTFKDALKFLQEDDDKATQVIALCGMGGVGKTTMMERLKKFAEDNNTFKWIAKVVIGQNPNMLSVQKDIAVYICGDLPEASISVRADHLNKTFKKLSQEKKKVLIIFDDVWKMIDLGDIGLPGPLPNGVKLLLTSRNSNTCRQIARYADSHIQVVNVNVLEVGEAEHLFSKETDEEKYQVGCQIVKKCGFLPFAIKVIASTLNSKDAYEWKNTLNRLMHNDLDKSVKEIIKISYENIEDDEHREIFLHCGFFPDDFDIRIEDLTRHAWGLNLLKNVSTWRDARIRTKTCVQNLINANLLIRSDRSGCVKMHDLVLSFMLDRVSRGDHLWITNHGNIPKWGGDEMRESCERISLTCMGMSEFPTDFKYPNLSLLQLMDGKVSLKFPEDFYGNMENLKVIAYYNMQYPLLPRSLQCSTKLKSLCFRDCKLMFDISLVGDLVNLEVLSFAGCRIRKLPSTIGNLRKLKLLDLTECVDLHIDDGVFINLENLEELYMRVWRGKGVRFTDANLEELKMLSSNLCALEVDFVTQKNTQLKNISFKNLDKFKIAMGCVLRVDKYNERNSLKLVTDSKNDLHDCKINELFKKTEELYLEVNDMIGLEDVAIHPHDQQSFCSLRDLEVSNCAELKYMCTISVARGLRKLERLIVSSCSALEALVHNDGMEIISEDEIIKFEELKFLSLENLPKLETLFLVENVVELPKLVELEVNELPKFTSIYPEKSDISSLQRPFLNSQVRILKLKKLIVKYMKTLKQICGGEEEVEVNNISMLREIEVEGCNNLVNLFPTNPMRLLNHLETLSVSECGSIKVIFNIDLGCVGEVEQVSNLRSIEVRDSENVREVWSIKGAENNNNSFHGFKGVESIRIEECNRFRNVFIPTNIKFDMRAKLDISRRNKESHINVISGEEEIPEEVVENIFNVEFPSSLIPTFPHQLSNLSLSNWESVKVVFEIMSDGSESQQQQILLLFPYLKHLSLQDMKMMTHVWKWNNKFLILQTQSSFHNLTTITLRSCDRIKYLFSPQMAKLLSNLKTINILFCDGMEEIVSNRDDEDEEMITSSTYTNTLFPCLHSLAFLSLKNLQRIGGGGGTVHDKLKVSDVVSWSLCQYPRKVEIESCDALSSVIPSNAVGQMQKLQVLKVRYCKLMKEVFETQGINNNNNVNMPTKLSNLKKLVILSCKLLEHVFTFSTLQSLGQLEELMVKDCSAMKEIVKNENGKQISKAVDFPRLKTLELNDLPNLEGFFLGVNIDFNWPLLENVIISKCPQMKMFTSGHSTTPALKDIHTSLGRHSLECGLNFHVTKDLHQTTLLPAASSEGRSLERLPWSFHNLIELQMECDDDDDIKCIIPSNELLQLQMLETIQVSRSFLVEDVFEAMEGTNSVVEIPNLTKVDLKYLSNLKYIWKSNHHQTVLKFPNLTKLSIHFCRSLQYVFTSVVEIQNLTKVELVHLSSLKYIWKSNHHQTVLKFPNLTTLSIERCNSLKHVFTNSMVGSIQQLQDLHILRCENMEVIVKGEEETEFESDAKVKEFPCLKSLKLHRLRSLKGFWLGNDDFSCPSLDTLEIKECPQLKVFTNGHVVTPSLDVIVTDFGRCYIRDDDDINSFIKTKLHEGFQF